MIKPTNLPLSISITSLLVLAACARDPSPASGTVITEVTTFTTTATSSADYTINGASDPTLVLKRGNTYTFNLNVAGHPFYIKSVSSDGTGNAYNSGVTGNGTTAGSLVFVVPSNAPATLFYNCSAHIAMAGTINVTD